MHQGADMATDYRDIAPEMAQFVYCPKCAAPLEDHVDDVNEYVRPTCPSCGWIYYPSNSMGALVVAESGDSIVVIHPPDAADADAALPGGIVEYGETPEQCVIREMKEETGLDITDVEEICRFLTHGPFGPMLHFGFRARVAGGLLVEGDEGPASLTPRDRLAPIAADREGSRRVLDAYLQSPT
jgi:NAD+ diphosphatase